MTVRRSIPQSKIDDRSFPVRLNLIVPKDGYRLDEALDWLRRQLGPNQHAWHSRSMSFPHSGAALYFRHPRAALAFMQVFPEFELADGVGGKVYTSPDRTEVRYEIENMCNLYNHTTNQDAIRSLFKGSVFADRLGNLQAGNVYPNQLAPIVRHDADGGLELVQARWGMPSPPSVLKTSRDPGVTNVRNLSSQHWRRWLGPAHRCLVPVSAFAEPLGKGQGDSWFGPVQDNTPMFFAGIEVRDWVSTRKVSAGETVDDLFAFLTCEPNAEVKAVHPKAMPVILTEAKEWELWMSAPLEIVAALQRPMSDGFLRVIEAPA